MTTPLTRAAALVTINDLLHLDGAVTFNHENLKCVLRDIDDGGCHKAYLDAADCRLLSVAFAVMADALSAPSCGECLDSGVIADRGVKIQPPPAAVTVEPCPFCSKGVGR